MKMKLMLSAGVILGILVVGTLFTHNAIADGTSDNHPFMHKVAEHFNLNADDVQSFMQEMREEKYQKHQALMEERLDKAIEDGLVTEAQKQAILDKHQEIMQEREQKRMEMQAWAEENGIDFGALREYGNGPFAHRHKFHHQGMHGW